MATNSSAIQKKIETLKKGLNNKFITASQKEKIKSQVEKLESQAKASAPKKASKPATTSLTRLQKMVNNKKYAVYKGKGVDLQKDSNRPAKAIGKRTSKSGKTYYEYRANRIDVKQPPKRYPKLEKGGYMAKGGMMAKDYRIVPMKPTGVKGMIIADYDYMERFSGTEDEAIARAKEMASSNPNFVRVEIKLPLKTKTNTVGIVDGQNKQFAKGGMMKNLDKIQDNIGKEVYDSIKKSSKDQLEKRLKDVKNELLFEEKNNGKSNRYYKLKDEEFLVLYRLERSNEFEYAKGGYMADGGRVKGRNNETGETYGVVIGSVKKSDENIEDGTEMNVRKSYSSRINEVKLVFDNNGNLYEITDYGYALEGNYPETSRGTVKTYIANKKETLEILSKKYNPAFAKKLIELAKNPKMAEGGMTEHGLKIGDTIVDNIFWDDSIKVLNNKTGYAVVDLENGERKGEMAKGGIVEHGLKIGDLIKRTEGDYIIVENDGKEYWVHLNSGYRDKSFFKEGGYMAEGGVTAKEVVESNADMVLSQIKAVKHHAEELSSVVSRKSNIEAWVVGKIERARTDLSDITHYLEGNKDKMSMGGTVRHYAHKMDKK